LNLTAYYGYCQVDCTTGDGKMRLQIAVFRNPIVKKMGQGPIWASCSTDGLGGMGRQTRHKAKFSLKLLATH
jgi:hypothetical protein